MNFYIIGHFNLNNIEETTKAFSNADIDLTRHGHNCINICAQRVPVGDVAPIAKKRLQFVCDADAVFVLPGWHNDPVAQLELILANLLGLKIAISPETIIPARICTDLNFNMIKKGLDDTNFPDFHIH